MTKKSTTINGEYIANLFEEKAEEMLAKEKAPKKKSTKKVAEKSEVKEPKKKTVKATKKADTEKVEKSEKSQSTEKPKTTKKVVAKKAEKPAKEQAEKLKKATKKAKAEKVEEVGKVQELRSLTSIKVAKTEYTVDDSINNYEDLVKAIESEKDVYVAFDISEVDSKEYESILHVPYEKSMKEKFDICTPIFVGEKNPRLVFASIYTEALWDLFPDEFDLLSAVLVEKPSKTKK